MKIDLNTAASTFSNLGLGFDFNAAASSFSNLGVSNNDIRGTAKYNQLIHEVEMYLDSSCDQSDSPRFKRSINPNSIINLTIEDTLSDWVVKGTITFLYDYNTPDFLNSNYGQYISTETQALIREKYFFRNDGNDRLRIRIKPKIENTNSGLTDQVSELVIDDEKFWTISHIFSVYDAEDIDLPPGAQNASSATLKCIKLYFWDYWYQKTLTNIVEYTTAKEDTGTRELKTGTAIKEIFQKVLQESTNVSIPYDPVSSGEDWDEGSTDIFFTSPAGYSAQDCIDYVLNRHVSSQTLSNGGQSIPDICLLSKERGPDATDPGVLTLRPLSKYFDKAGNSQEGPGEFQIEHFFVQNYGNPKTPSGQFRAPLASQKNNSTVDIKTQKYHTITSYRFVDVAAITNSLDFNTTPVHSFNFKERSYNIEFTNNNVLDARKFIYEKYIKNLYKGNDDEKTFLITIDEDKEQLKNIKPPVFSVLGDYDDPIYRSYAGIKPLIYTGLFQNTCINFRTLGLTYREPGRFIGIDKSAGTTGGEFEDKLFGQWFVINVKHIFEGEIYYNDITAVKLHRHYVLQYDVPASA